MAASTENRVLTRRTDVPLSYVGRSEADVSNDRGRYDEHHTLGITDGTNGRPIISGMVVRDDTVYLAASPRTRGCITAQTQQVL